MERRRKYFTNLWSILALLMLSGTLFGLLANTEAQPVQAMSVKKKTVTPTPTHTPSLTATPTPTPASAGTPTPTPNPGPNGTWNLVTSPNTGWPNNYLYGVSGVASNDVWAVGTDSTYPLIESWNGNSWSIFTSPNPSGGGALWGVTAITSCDVWAVGQTSATNIGYQTLTEHFTCQ